MAELILTILILLAVFLSGYLVHSIKSSYDQAARETQLELERLTKRLNAAVEQNELLSKRVDAMKGSRNPYLTNVALEDAIAIVMDNHANLEYQDIRLRQLMSVLGQARRDPAHYDEDRPNGKRG